MTPGNSKKRKRRQQSQWYWAQKKKKKNHRKPLTKKKSNWGLITKSKLLETQHATNPDRGHPADTGVEGCQWYSRTEGQKYRKRKRQHPSASLCLNCITVTRAQCMNLYVRFAYVRYTKYFLGIVSKVHVKYFLFIMKYYEKYMMQANSKSSCFTSAISEGSVISEKGGQR